MNILLNNYCNLNCSYCFASKVMDQEKRSITLEDFNWLVKFMENSDLDECRILGGEPTLHPDFLKILDIIKSEHFKSTMIFTNGIFSDKVLNALVSFSNDKQINLLVNYNNPLIIGHDKNNIIINNLDKLAESKVKFALSLNFYNPDIDYSYIIDAAKKYNCNIRWSIAVPMEPINDIKGYYASFVPNIYKFIKECDDNNILYFQDCNSIPECVMENDDIKQTIKSHYKCGVVCDITPDMNVIKCFGLSDYPLPIKDFDNIRQVTKVFNTMVEAKFSKPICNECNTCDFANSRCCVCKALLKGATNAN